jgi:hypothetical protein
LCKLVWIELDDLLFQLFDSGHGVLAEQVYGDRSASSR